MQLSCDKSLQGFWRRGSTQPKYTWNGAMSYTQEALNFVGKISPDPPPPRCFCILRRSFTKLTSGQAMTRIHHTSIVHAKTGGEEGQGKNLLYPATAQKLEVGKAREQGYSILASFPGSPHESLGTRLTPYQHSSWSFVFFCLEQRCPETGEKRRRSGGRWEPGAQGD